MIFEDIIKGIPNDKDELNTDAIKAIVNEIRKAAGSKARGYESVQSLTRFLKNEPQLAATFRNYLVQLFNQHDPLTLYTDVGILPGHGFFAETFKRFRYKILPPLENKNSAEYLIRQVFYNRNDYKRTVQADNPLWLSLFTAIHFETNAIKWDASQLNYLLNALMVLSQRITAIGLEPELISKLPDIDDLQSPFFGLYREVQNYVDSFKDDSNYLQNNVTDYKQILVMCTQCEASIDQFHKYKDEYGISVNMAYLMLRMEQHIRRLKTVLKLIQHSEATHFNEVLVSFVNELIYAENKKYSIRKHLNDNLSLIAYKITEHSSNKGEHYRTADRKEYWSMFKSAMGGGLIVAFLVLLKVFAHHMHLPPFGEAFTYSMIYAGGFILIHLLHFTLATKQPAMTANTIATVLDGTDKKDKEMLKSVQLIAEISSAQFISLVGNILIVLPGAYLVGWIYFYYKGINLVDVNEAHEMMNNLHPWNTGSLFYAAVAGVFLMASGLIAGYYDNKVVYSKIPERLQQHPLLKRIIPQKLLLKLTNYLRNNLGIILGNFFLGIFLGSAPLLGKFFGLPIDVRHVTLSTGNFGLALQCLHELPETIYLVEIIFGIVMMGLINLFVSFGLAIYVAVRSRSLQTSLMRRLLYAITIYFRAYPKSFFMPGK
ncbi:MAG: site-specific recombinase [Bacteroidia bacterium]